MVEVSELVYDICWILYFIVASVMYGFLACSLAAWLAKNTWTKIKIMAMQLFMALVWPITLGWITGFFWRENFLVKFERWYDLTKEDEKEN